MDTRTKILSPGEAEPVVRAAQRDGRTVVLCHGCFDIVHPGHVRHLQHAARLGDCLVVSITGDSMMNKGAGRPLIPQELRAENLAALDCVDWVVVHQAPTAVDLLRALRPDVYVKGREYEVSSDPQFQAEKDVVEGYGGRLVFTSGDVVFSSSMTRSWRPSGSTWCPSLFAISACSRSVRRSSTPTSCATAPTWPAKDRS